MRLSLTITALIGLFALADCAPLHAESAVEQKLQKALDGFMQQHWFAPGATVSLDSEQLGLHWNGASGVADLDTRQPISPEQPVRLASTTKTYVAAAVLRLYELGRLDLDDSIEAHLPANQIELLANDRYRTSEITVRHLLTHTAGLFDHALSDAYQQAVTADPQHQWTPDEQVAFAAKYGDPLGQPGEIYFYSDTGYVLLGGIIERHTGRKLGPAVRELLGLDRLALKSTWWEIMEPAPEAALPRAHQYFMDMDSTGWHASLDLYGGGGLIASMPDLARFYEALFEGEVFARPSTLVTMKTSIVPEKGGPVHSNVFGEDQQYCMGLHSHAHRGLTLFSHGGFWGTIGAYVPSLDLAVGVNVTQPRPRPAVVDLMNVMLDVVFDHYDVGFEADSNWP